MVLLGLHDRVGIVSGSQRYKSRRGSKRLARAVAELRAFEAAIEAWELRQLLDVEDDEQAGSRVAAGDHV